MTATTYILTLSCQDVRGIVAAVTGFLASHDGFITESTQFGDPSTQRFFMRVQFSAGEYTPNHADLSAAFLHEVADRFAMDWRMDDASRKARVLILCSKQLHCLNDLLHRYRTGQLMMEIPAVISNHPDARGIVEWHGIPFHHLPITPTSLPLEGGGKEGVNSAHSASLTPTQPSPLQREGLQAAKLAQEHKIRAIIEAEQIDCVVLARYMQILSPELSALLRGRAINIHHSFLPSFKGAKPYHQAHERGVKLIGATAHYVTDALDEGPIIDQEVTRVDHSYSPEQLALMGQDIEAQVLTRSLKYQLEHRVLLNGTKTVVFR